MKKFLSSVLCLAMLLSMGTTAFASNISTDGGSQDVVVSYGMSEGFTVMIPSAISLESMDGDIYGEGIICAENVMIGAGKTLKVRLSGHDYVDKWELIDTNESANRLTYSVTTENLVPVYNNDVILSVASGEIPHNQKLAYVCITLLDEMTKAGNYTDTLTFTVEVEAILQFSLNMPEPQYNYTDEYNYKKGMTWEDFVDSSFNPSGTFFITDGGEVIYAGTYAPVRYENRELVKPGDIIDTSINYLSVVN